MKISKQNLKTRWKNKFMNQEQFNKNHVNFFMVNYNHFIGHRIFNINSIKKDNIE